MDSEDSAQVTSATDSSVADSSSSAVNDNTIPATESGMQEKNDNPAFDEDLQNGYSKVAENGDKFPKSGKVSPSGETSSSDGDEKKKEEEQKVVGLGELVSRSFIII